MRLHNWPVVRACSISTRLPCCLPAIIIIRGLMHLIHQVSAAFKVIIAARGNGHTSLLAVSTWCTAAHEECCCPLQGVAPRRPSAS